MASCLESLVLQLIHGLAYTVALDKDQRNRMMDKNLRLCNLGLDKNRHRRNLGCKTLSLPFYVVPLSVFHLPEKEKR